MKRITISSLLVLILFSGCKEESVDQERPGIIFHTESNLLQNCDTLWLGESFTFSALFTDNQELGSFSLEIHENFDHHSHSTESEACNLDPVKEPVNPFMLLKDFTIPEGLTQYEASEEISIPTGDNEGDFDEGDYDLSISLTDREGRATQKVLSIKLMRR